MVTYCANRDSYEVFRTQIGFGVPDGMVRYNGQIMTYEEAQADGIARGTLIEFRSTESFWFMLDHFYKHGYDDAIIRHCASEEFDYDEVIRILEERKERNESNNN